MPTSINGFGFVDDNGNKSIAINLSNCRRMTYSEYQQLSESERNGAIIITDYPIPEESDEVYVTGDGVKNIRTLLNELYNAADHNKISDRSYIEYADSLWRLSVANSSGYFFERSFTAGNTIYHGTIFMAGGTSVQSDYYPSSMTNSGVTVASEGTSRIIDSGVKIILHYNYYKNEDIHTEYSAENCYLSNGNSVEEEVLNKTCLNKLGTIVKGGNSIDVTVPSSYQGLLLIGGGGNANSAPHGLYLISPRGSSHVRVDAILEDTNISISVSALNITITNNNSSYNAVVTLIGNGNATKI